MRIAKSTRMRNVGSAIGNIANVQDMEGDLAGRTEKAMKSAWTSRRKLVTSVSQLPL